MRYEYVLTSDRPGSVKSFAVGRRSYSETIAAYEYPFARKIRTVDVAFGAVEMDEIVAPYEYPFAKIEDASHKFDRFSAPSFQRPLFDATLDGKISAGSTETNIFGIETKSFILPFLKTAKLETRDSEYKWEVVDLFRYIAQEAPFRYIIKGRKLNKTIYPRCDIQVQGTPMASGKFFNIN